MKLRNKVKEYAAGIVATDYWKSCSEMIRKERLAQTNGSTTLTNQAETYAVESYNGRIRHFSARFRWLLSLSKYEKQNVIPSPKKGLNTR
jgi:IS1 family transposase